MGLKYVLENKHLLSLFCFFYFHNNIWAVCFQIPDLTVDTNDIKELPTHITIIYVPKTELTKIAPNDEVLKDR